MNQALVNSICQRYNALLLAMDRQRIQIAVAGSPSPEMLEMLRFATQQQVEVTEWSTEKLEKQRQQQAGIQIPVQTMPTVTLVEQLLQQALQQRASDIHVEPAEQGFRVRVRVDGVLHELPTMADNPSGIIARLKVLAELDIAERRLPQDGQFSISLLGKNLSFRLATLPCRWGEKAVLRLLQQSHQALETESLGMTELQQQAFCQALQRPQGLILVTGPTGSGKTITLYSALNRLNRPQINICSAEDPIEIPLDGLNQTQINPKANLHFHTVLRALLRQDPDVIMIGEIRDAETAEIAINAAQTGHLVLSTLHTTSTVETLTRLEQMGVARWLLASALELVIAQRLVRRLCPHCCTRLDSSSLQARSSLPQQLPVEIWPRPLPLWQANGCDRCYGGYYGRLALFETLAVSDVLRQHIIDGLPTRQITQQARQQGMITLLEHGCQAVEQGLTTVQELWRVLGTPHG